MSVDENWLSQEVLIEKTSGSYDSFVRDLRFEKYMYMLLCMGLKPRTTSGQILKLLLLESLKFQGSSGHLSTGM